jgi:tetrapyrrole methylase family protein/MazG family protein
MDFPGIADAIDKLKEEIAEVEQSSPEEIVEECGDMLFSAVNVSRLAGVEPETALQRATDKFIARFNLAETYARDRGIDMRSCSVNELNALWDMAKGIK